MRAVGLSDAVKPVVLCILAFSSVLQVVLLLPLANFMPTYFIALPIGTAVCSCGLCVFQRQCVATSSPHSAQARVVPHTAASSTNV